MKIGYLTNNNTPEVIWNCIHFPSSNAACSYLKYESVASLIRGISKSETDFGVITEDAFRDYLIYSHAEKPPDQILSDQILIIARFLIQETSCSTASTGKYHYTLYYLIG